MQLRREIGRQFLILLLSPFLGISLIIADLKVGVKLPALQQKMLYLNKATRSKGQNRLIKQLVSPSLPQADLLA
jgi:hypothetical protein